MHHQYALKFTKSVWIVLINLSKRTRTKKGYYSNEIVMGKCTRTPREYGNSEAKDSLLHFVSWNTGRSWFIEFWIEKQWMNDSVEPQSTSVCWACHLFFIFFFWRWREGDGGRVGGTWHLEMALGLSLHCLFFFGAGWLVGCQQCIWL